MKLPISITGAVLFAIVGVASAQTPNPTVDSYIATAKAAAGTDWAGTFLRLCIPPSAGPLATGGGPTGKAAAPRTPARDTWYAEPPRLRITSISWAPGFIAHGPSPAAKAL